MEQFNLEKYLENPSRKIITRDGRPVKIICPKSPYDTIVGFCGKDEYPDLWDLNGKYLKDKDSVFDLFFADEELTEFEKELVNLVSGWCDSHIETPEEYINKHSRTLLDLARKELQPEFDKEMDKMLAETDKVVYQKGQQDALKSLPKWKKITKREQNYLVYGYLSNDEYYLSIQELKDKLPKEE